MIVAAGGQGFFPGLRPVRLDPLPLGHRRDHLGREIAEDGPQEVRRAAIARSVDQLEARKEQQQPFELVDGQPAVDAEQHVGHRTDDILAHQVFLQAVDIGPQFLDHAELLFVDAGDEDVDLAAVLREVGRDFIGEERAGKVGDLQRAANAVVVGDGHEVHPLLPRVAIDFLGFDKRFRSAHAAEEPFAGAIGILAVNVEIAFRDACIMHGWDPSWNRPRRTHLVSIHGERKQNATLSQVDDQGSSALALVPGLNTEFLSRNHETRFYPNYPARCEPA